MGDANFHNRIKDLYRMLFEMATGNLSFRLPPDDRGDDLANLLQSLSMFAAQFQLAIRKSGYVVPFYTYQNLAQLIFVLDSDLAIIAFSSQIPIMLSHQPDELFSARFETLLAPDSKTLWQMAAADLESNESYHETLHLRFIASDGRMAPAVCTISRLLYTDTVFISSITTNLSELAELNLSASAAARASDAAVIQSLYEYIMGNLAKPLPTLKELAHIFNTNEFTLKEGFRHFFNTSIYRFYNNERLNRAHLLIQQSGLSLKAVALMSGFKDYVTFAKAFRKKFGYAPGGVIRNPEK